VHECNNEKESGWLAQAEGKSGVAPTSMYLTFSSAKSSNTYMPTSKPGEIDSVVTASSIIVHSR
jgi:hypothetical protein